jgi:hypothetical protein
MTGGANATEYMGCSVSGAGDVNNDGYDDVIVGAYGYLTRTGRAYIYYGGSSMNNTADVTMTGGAVGDWFGYSVSGAGDVNKDGYADVIVGAYGYLYDIGRVYIYYGGINMDVAADVTMTEIESSNYFGYSVSGAGDVNKDGYADVIVGAYGYSSNTGRAYIYYGGNSMDNGADIMMTGEGTNSRFGRSVSGAGDVNKDGYADVIVGADGYASIGRAYIYHGGSNMNNTADVTMTGEASGNYFGRSVSGAGDVNNDGYDDVIVGARAYSSYTGRTFIYYGGSSMNNTVDVTMTAVETDNSFGYRVSGAGDVNNDGYADVIIGAIGYSSYTGRAYIYYGGSNMNNTADVTMTGETAGDQFGRSVSGAGDVNDDGYDDVIVGAYFYSSYTGRAYIYYGGDNMDNTADVTMTGGAGSYFGGSVSGAGDVNNDGFDDVIVGSQGYYTPYYSTTGRANIYYGGSSMNNVADVTMSGVAAVDNFGQSVSGAGDVNNDGFGDVIVGASGYSSNTGRAYIYYGGSSMNTVADVTMTGGAASDHFGYSVSGAGNVNNDSYDDVIVGAHGYSLYKGRTYIYYGGSSMNNGADVTMNGGSASDHFGYSVSGTGNVNNDSYDDVIVGAYGYSAETGRAYIYYGGSSMNSTVDITMTGEGTNIRFGRSVSGVGDVNNDGYDDVMVGSAKYPLNGKVYIYSDNTAPLPVELTSFTASVNGICVVLNWQTATEVNNYGFEIEKSDVSSQTSENEWEMIGFIEGHGNSNSPKEYSFVDSNPNSGINQYRLKQIDVDGSFEYSEIVKVEIELPTEFKLAQNYPNPFNPSTVIQYSIPAVKTPISGGVVTLKIYNLLGQEVATLVNKKQVAGRYEVEFNASSLVSGVYFYRLVSTGFVKTKKLILLR